jgi:hypothetical protein
VYRHIIMVEGRIREEAILRVRVDIGAIQNLYSQADACTEAQGPFGVSALCIVRRARH